MRTPGETQLEGGAEARRRQGPGHVWGVSEQQGWGLRGPHIPQGTSSKKFHAPARTRKIKDVLPYAIIYPERVMKASLPLIIGREAN